MLALLCVLGRLGPRTLVWHRPELACGQLFNGYLSGRSLLESWEEDAVEEWLLTMQYFWPL